MEDEQIQQFRRILNEFSVLPKPNMDPTFLDVCNIKRGKFEERCSQILRFFFDQQGPHKLHDLFLKSILETIGVKKNITDLPGKSNYREATTKVLTEEVTGDNKKIDITIIADNFVIAIENKIEAELYNPLDCYQKYIDNTYQQANKYYVVLSIRRITSRKELEKIAEQHYVYINYEEFFDTVKKNLGLYAMNCNQAYLTFLLDFIRTIENRYYNRNMEEINNFFFDNHQRIEEFKRSYDCFYNQIHEKQSTAIDDIKQKLKDLTNVDWTKYSNWDLWVKFNADTDKEIGIECNFKCNYEKRNPLGKFHIYITVWRKECFSHYEKELAKKYKGCLIDDTAENGKRVYLHLPVMESESVNTIVDKLKEYYNDLKEIVDKVNG